MLSLKLYLWNSFTASILHFNSLIQLTGLWASLRFVLQIGFFLQPEVFYCTWSDRSLTVIVCQWSYCVNFIALYFYMPFIGELISESIFILIHFPKEIEKLYDHCFLNAFTSSSSSKPNLVQLCILHMQQ